MRRLSTVVASAAHPTSPAGDTWVSVALSFQGLKALGVPQHRSRAFAPEFQQGMAARAQLARRRRREQPGRTGRSRSDPPMSTSSSRLWRLTQQRLAAALERARREYEELDGSHARSGGRIAMCCPDEREAFGFKDGISHPAIEGSGHSGFEPARASAEGGRIRARIPRRNERAPVDPSTRHPGAQWQLRRVSQAPSARRRVPPVPEGARAEPPKNEELLAAKMMGRWRSGAPLALLSACTTIPSLGADARAEQRLPVQGGRSRSATRRRADRTFVA